MTLLAAVAAGARVRAEPVVAPGDALSLIIPTRYTLPTGITQNATTGRHEGTVMDTTYSLPTGGTTWTPTTEAELTTALTNCARGDVIVLPNQGTKVFSGTFALPAKAGTGWIYIVSQAMYDGTFPKAPGQRVTAADTAYMAKIITTGSGPAFYTARGAGTASYYRLCGIEATCSTLGTSTLSDGLFMFGSGAAAEQNAVEEIPTHLIADRCYLHGLFTGDDATGTKLVRGLSLHCAYGAAIDCRIDQIGGASIEAQAIAGWNGPGPYKITNNYLDGSTENVMFGGADPAISGQLPNDIEFRWNHVETPRSRQGVWTKKNIFELKLGKRVLVEGNVFAGSWVDAQIGFGIVLYSVNQGGGSATWSEVSDVTFVRNRVEDTEHGFQLTDSYAGTATPMSRVQLAGNVLVQSASGRTYQVARNDAADTPFASVAIEHNTAIGGSGMQFVLATAETDQFSGWIIQNNIGVGEMRSDFQSHETAWDTYFAGSTFQNNALIGEAVANYDGFGMTGNIAPATETDMQYVDLAGGNYRLGASSPGKSAGVSGVDMGANLDDLDDLLTGVV